MMDERDLLAAQLAAVTAERDENEQDVIRLLVDVREKHAIAYGDGDNDDERYYQGKKDGLRTALSLLCNLEKDQKRWELANEVSPNQIDFDVPSFLAGRKKLESALAAAERRAETMAGLLRDASLLLDIATPDVVISTEGHVQISKTVLLGKIDAALSPDGGAESGAK